MVLLVLFILSLGALGLWLEFKYDLIYTKLLGTGLAKHNGWKSKKFGNKVQCLQCSRYISFGETTAYCDKCKKYL